MYTGRFFDRNVPSTCGRCNRHACIVNAAAHPVVERVHTIVVFVSSQFLNLMYKMHTFFATAMQQIFHTNYRNRQGEHVSV